MQECKEHKQGIAKVFFIFDALIIRYKCNCELSNDSFATSFMSFMQVGVHKGLSRLK